MTISIELPDKHKTMLRLFCEGLSAKQVASKMGMNRRTVEAYVGRLLFKFDCKNITELCVLATKNNIL